METGLRQPEKKLEAGIGQGIRQHLAHFLGSRPPSAQVLQEALDFAQPLIASAVEPPVHLDLDARAQRTETERDRKRRGSRR